MTSVGQTVASAGLMFVLYRAVLNALGADGLGVWSVVIATTGAARVAELGLAGSAVKYVAMYSAQRNAPRAGLAAETTVVSIAVGALVAALVAFVAVRPVLGWFIPAEGLADAQRLLPYACASLWLTSIGGAAQSALDGYHRYDLRNAALLVGQAVYVGLALVLMRTGGLVGLAMAQIVQGALVIALAWAALRRVTPEVSVVPHRWDRGLFREMLGYGAQYQGLAVLRMVYDPVTKACLSAFGGLSLAGFFEMASQAVLKLRALLVAAQQVLTPEIAERQEQRPDGVDEVFATANRLNWALCLALFGAVAAAAPLLSHLWIGRYVPSFVLFSALLAVGWGANALSGPGFFLLLGVGRLGPLLASHTTTAVVNVVAGVGLGLIFGGTGVVVGWTLSLVAGAVHLLVWLQRARHLPMGPPRGLAPLAVASGAGATLALAWTASAPASWRVALAATLAFGLLISLPLWRTGVPARLLAIAGRTAPA